MIRSRRQFILGSGAAALALSILPRDGSACSRSETHKFGFMIDAMNLVTLSDVGFEDIDRSQLGMVQLTVGTGMGEPGEPAYTYEAALHDIAKWQGGIARYPDRLIQIRNAEDIDRADRECKFGIMLGFQNGTHFERDIRNVQFFFDLGIRQVQLTYNQLNALGAGCTEAVDPGLSIFGRQVVQEMNRLGIVVDLSHCGTRTTLEGIEASTRPVVFSHTNCGALNDNPRCKSDLEIKRLAETGGVMGLTVFDFYVTSKPVGTLDDFMAHIDHVVDLVGIDHVGIGSDLLIEGMGDVFPTEESYIERLKTVSNFPLAPGERWPMVAKELDRPEKSLVIGEQLAKRGYEKSDIDKVLGGNFRRIYSDILGGPNESEPTTG